MIIKAGVIAFLRPEVPSAVRPDTFMQFRGSSRNQSRNQSCPALLSKATRVIMLTHIGLATNNCRKKWIAARYAGPNLLIRRALIE